MSVVFDNLFSVLMNVNIRSLYNFVLLGDFNVNMFNPSHFMYTHLCKLIDSFSLFQCVKEGTHPTQSGTSSLIDLAFVSRESTLHSCHVIPPLGNSDHFGIELVINQSSTKQRIIPSRKVWLYNLADFESANALLECTDWSTVLHGDVSRAWNNWKQVFLRVMEQCIPQTVLKKKHLPWINSALMKRLLKKRNSAYRHAKKSGLPHHWHSYKQKRNHVANLLKSSKHKYLSNINPCSPK